MVAAPTDSRRRFPCEFEYMGCNGHTREIEVLEVRRFDIDTRQRPFGREPGTTAGKPQQDIAGFPADFGVVFEHVIAEFSDHGLWIGQVDERLCCVGSAVH